MSGLPDKLTEVTVGISGRTLHSRKVSCSTKRKNPRSSIGEAEVRQITKERYRETLGDGDIVFEAIPQRYDTDDRIGINEFELDGMEASQIDAYFKLFGGRAPSCSSIEIVATIYNAEIQNLYTCPRRKAWEGQGSVEAQLPKGFRRHGSC